MFVVEPRRTADGIDACVEGLATAVGVERHHVERLHGVVAQASRGHDIVALASDVLVGFNVADANDCAAAEA